MYSSSTFSIPDPVVVPRGTVLNRVPTPAGRGRGRGACRSVWRTTVLTVRTVDTHSVSSYVAVHALYASCLGAPPSPRVRCRLALVILTYLLRLAPIVGPRERRLSG